MQPVVAGLSQKGGVAGLQRPHHGHAAAHLPNGRGRGDLGGKHTAGVCRPHLIGRRHGNKAQVGGYLHADARGVVALHEGAYQAAHDGRGHVVGMSLDDARELKAPLAVIAGGREGHGAGDSRDDADRAGAKAARERDGGEDRDLEGLRLAAELAAGGEVALPDEVVLATEALLAAVDLKALCRRHQERGREVERQSQAVKAHAYVGRGGGNAHQDHGARLSVGPDHRKTLAQELSTKAPILARSQTSL